MSFLQIFNEKAIPTPLSFLLCLALPSLKTCLCVMLAD